MLWVQQVDVVYTKASRGAPGATIRNQLARAFLMHAAEAPFVYERYELRERNDFAPQIEKTIVSETPIHIESSLLLIEASSKQVILGLAWSAYLGQPPRRTHGNAVKLSPGETARLITNGRFTGYSGQTYTESTYNVAFGDDLPADVFTRGAPTHVFDVRADLF